ncbi:predicted protein [Histoplasma capsulatum H143]|uniref:Uncharacterized protein n=1 Tax=Ajellomyces capsulatus (strain H143) TaxID=544712 RepID=C6HDI7_AJECH|nr:predicted protein [Histoplasma capsulatum H143]
MRHWQDVILPPKVAVGCPQGMYISSFSSAHVLAPEDARISGAASNDRHALGPGIPYTYSHGCEKTEAGNLRPRLRDLDARMSETYILIVTDQHAGRSVGPPRGLPLCGDSFPIGEDIKLDRFFLFLLQPQEPGTDYPWLAAVIIGSLAD